MNPEMEEPFLPFARASLGEEEIQEVIETLRSGWLTMGPRTRQFEMEFAQYVGVPHAVAVNSATSGLFLLLKVLGIGPGDEVITAPLTFAATANVIVHCGARPVFADVKRDGWSLDPAAVEAAITPRTKAIIVVHYAGAPADIEPIEATAAKWGIRIVEDCAHAIGAHYLDGTVVGSRNPSAYSFYATKNLTTGEGGMMTVRDEELAARLRSLRLHGISQDAWKRYSKEGTWYYEVLEAGYKMNTTDLNAALGLHQLRKLDRFNARRREICRSYNQAFRDLPVMVPDWVAEERSAAHLYPLLLREANRRDKLMAGLAARNIGTSVHFIPLHLQPAYRNGFGYRRGQFPNAEWFFERCVSLPLYPGLTDAEVERVVCAVREVLG